MAETPTQRAVAAFRAGVPEAESLLRAVLGTNPGDVFALHYLGLLRFQSGACEAGLALVQQAVITAPGYAAALGSMGNMLASLGRPHEAIQSYNALLALQPEDAMTHYNRALALQGLGRAAAALEGYNIAIRLRPGYPPAHANRGLVLRALGRLEAAIASFDAALQIDPTLPLVHTNRANALLEKGDIPAALAAIDEAIHHAPDHAEAHNSRAAILHAQGDLPAAIAACDTAIALRPDLAEAWLNRGITRLASGDRAGAIADYRAALSHHPRYAKAQYNLGVVLQDEGDLDAAAKAYEQAIRLTPDDHAAITNLATCHLARGDMAQGWALYEHRDPLFAYKGDPRLLTPEKLALVAGRRVLVLWEIGLGDTIQFVRYLVLLRARGATVIASVQASLRPLLRNLQTEISYVEEGASIEVDYIVRLLSLPWIFATTLDSVPWFGPYLHAEPDRIALWRSRLGAHGRHIGVCWQGAQRADMTGRSFPPEALAPVAAVPGVRLLALQPGGVAPGLPGIETFGPDFDQDAFLDTAAVMMSCEMVITCDTAVAHLAGALGVPVWLALKHVPDWRWMCDREDTPWYPSMRLFRQAAEGDWGSVFAHMAAALNATGVLIPVSCGEVLDRASILRLKAVRLRDPAARRNVAHELGAIAPVEAEVLARDPSLTDLAGDLAAVNARLWDIEDALRAHEAVADFGPAFIECARAVYRENDARAALRRAINERCGKGLMDEKQYGG